MGNSTSFNEFTWNWQSCHTQIVSQISQCSLDWSIPPKLIKVCKQAIINCMFIYMYYFISQLESDQSAKNATSANQSSQWEESSQGEIYPSTSSAVGRNKKKSSVSGRVFHRSTRVHEESTAARETSAATAENSCLLSKVFSAVC